MFFDSSCGPCTFFARITAGLSRSGPEVYPLDGPEADRALQSMSSEARYSSFHIVEPGKTWTGPDAMPAWVGLVAGNRARWVAEKARPVNRLLRRFYDGFWEYRRSRGCAAEGAPHA
jgi:predicted DCC family thiol-disulfide oxidoreductase YuxK